VPCGRGRCFDCFGLRKLYPVFDLPVGDELMDYNICIIGEKKSQKFKEEHQAEILS
jgi:hypothetical protein